MQHQRPEAEAWRAYSPREAAGIVAVPVKQILAAIKRGDLDHVVIGKHYRISDSALRRFAGQDPSDKAAA